MPANDPVDRAPASATVISVLILVYEVIVVWMVFVSGMGVAVYRWARAMGGIEPAGIDAVRDVLLAAFDSMLTFSVLTGVARAAVAGVGLAAAVGLLARRAWSVRAATAYAAGSIGLSLFRYVVVGERARQLGRTLGSVADAAVATLGASVVVLLGALVLVAGAAFPVVVIVVANQGRVRRYVEEA
jgi:hypothetical protein